MSHEPTQTTPPTDGLPPSKNGRWGWALAAIVLVWAAFMMYIAPGGQPRKPDLRKPEPQHVTSISYDWSLVDLDGKVVPFSEFKGKTVFLNFWATWCPPCIQEMPSINRLVVKESLKDVAFLGISIDEDEDALKEFVASKQPRFRVLRPLRTVPDILQTEGIPATFIIGPTGEIATAHVGTANWDAPEVASLLEHLSRGPKDQ